jgi:hypothetical protein
VNVPDAESHLLDADHFALEAHDCEIAAHTGLRWSQAREAVTDRDSGSMKDGR